MTDELAEQMVAKTEELTEAKKGDEAVIEATELAQIDPNDAIVWFVKGKAHYIDNQFEEALACFSKAAELDSNNAQIWHMLGYCLITMNDLPKAEECLAFVKAVQPDNCEALCALGISQAMQDKPKEARVNFDLALSINKSVAFAMLENFHEKFVSPSKEASSKVKALIERTLETVKIVK